EPLDSANAQGLGARNRRRISQGAEVGIGVRWTATACGTANGEVQRIGTRQCGRGRDAEACPSKRRGEPCDRQVICSRREKAVLSSLGRRTGANAGTSRRRCTVAQLTLEAVR